MTDATQSLSATESGALSRANLSDTLLRFTVGGMLIPHGIGKFLSYNKEVEVFGQVFGLNPAPAWVIGAAIFQIAVGLAIMSGRYVRPAAVLLIVFMLGTIIVANHSAWFWQFKGAEYSVFWALMALVLVLKPER
jgi:uncharacterized membrane protein YphA (DoxX/SURF4 family)